MAKGIDFEIKALKYLRFLFEHLGFRVTAERQQDTGTQNGFDLRISFFDDSGKLRHFYFECKDYNSTLYWDKLLTKIIELNTSRHQVDGFIAMSPNVDLSNIHSNINEHLPTLVKFPIEFWTPGSSVKEYFSLDEAFYNSIYGHKPTVTDTENEHIRQKLRAVVLEMLRQKDQLALANGHTTLPKELSSKIPRIHQDDIIGREDELKDLHTLLFNNKQVVVVNGLGGIGKTTLAQAYLSKYYNDYHHIAWVSQLTSDIAHDIVNVNGLAENLSVSKQDKEMNQVFDEILRRLKACSDGPNLLILDNADEALTRLKDILPGQPDWHLLITSRHRIESFYPKTLDFLSPSQALALFKKHCTRIKRDEQIAGLLKAIDYHTLTIEILAKTAERQKLDLETLKRAISEDLRSNVYVNHKGDKIDKVFSYLSSIFNLSGLNEEEAWLMKQFTCLPAEFHTYDLLLELINPSEDKKEAFAETIERLVELGWLLKNTGTEAYKMHLVVKEVAVRQLPPTLQDIEGLLGHITGILKIDQSKDNPVDKFRWIAYGYVLLNNFPDDTAAVIALLQNNLAIVLKELGDYKAARALLETAMRSDEQNFGPFHPATAIRYSNLAMVLKDLGEYTEARVWLEKAIHSDEKSFGPDHPITASRYSNLAMVLQDLGAYSGARELLEKAMHSNEQNFGPDHPNTTRCYSNLAIVLNELGDYTSARVLLEKALHSDERNFGPLHPSTAVKYSNLATVLQALGDYAGARELLEKVLHSAEQNFGINHPNTARTYSNLATVLEAMGDYNGARALLEKAMNSAEQNFGINHPITAGSYSNLAVVLKGLGDYTAARTLLEKAMYSDERNFGLLHPHTARTYSNLALVLEALGDYAEAQVLLLKALHSDEQNFGPDHPNTATSYLNLAAVIYCLGDYTQALELSGKSLLVFKRTLPPNHPYIINAQRIYDSIKVKL